MKTCWKELKYVLIPKNFQIKEVCKIKLSDSSVHGTRVFYWYYKIPQIKLNCKKSKLDKNSSTFLKEVKYLYSNQTWELRKWRLISFFWSAKSWVSHRFFIFADMLIWMMVQIQRKFLSYNKYEAHFKFWKKSLEDKAHYLPR